ncbi:MAG TPA: cytochrome C oxidase subunit IV family protein [Thermoanaerobaculia bacterium]|jgi:cytochrome c oxidase subunit 4
MTDNAAPHNAAHWAPDQQAGGIGHEPLGEHEHPTHEHHGHDNSPEAIRKEIRKYLYVFGALAVLTIVTVAISQLHLPTHLAIILALSVALVKGSLVAAFFMHLISERKLIYAVLLMTVFFFGMLLWGPWHQRDNAEKVWPGYDLNASKPAPGKPAPEHSGH